MTTNRTLDWALVERMFGSTEEWCGISASNAGAVKDCPARLALPQVRESSEQAERGNALHEFARKVTKNPNTRDVALLDVPDEWRHTAAGMNLDSALFGLEVLGCELAFALDVKKRTVRFIGENIARDYNGELLKQGKPKLSRYEIPMSMDIVGKVGEIPCELDWKSGRSIGDPAEHWQRRLCAAALIFHYDASEAFSRVGYIWDNGDIKPDGAPFTLFDAEDFCDDMVKTIDAVWQARLLVANGIMPTVAPSDSACNYCSAINSCPYYLNFAYAMAGRMDEINKLELTTLSGPEMLKVWEDVKRAAKVVEAMVGDGGRLKKLAKENPFGDDKYEVAPKAQPGRKSFNGSLARGELVKAWGKLGLTDEEIEKEMAKLNTQGPPIEVYTKRKRQLPVV